MTLCEPKTHARELLNDAHTTGSPGRYPSSPGFGDVQGLGDRLRFVLRTNGHSHSCLSPRE